MQWPQRIFRALLRLFPAAFRQDYANEMTTVFLDQHRLSSGWPRVRLWIDTLADLSAGAMKEHCSMFLDDFRIAFRRLRLQPGFTAIAVLSLALGIGANTAIFSLMHATVLRPVPFREPGRLVMLTEQQRARDGWFGVASADFLDLREQSKSFESLAMFTIQTMVTLGGGAGQFPERISQQGVEPGFFEMLGLQPRAGRFFTRGDAGMRDERVTLVSEGFWKRRLASDPAVAGRKIIVDGAEKTIIGVVPASYDAGWISQGVDLWAPIDLEPGSNWIQRKVRWMSAAGRLKKGASIEQANVELKGISERLESAYPDTNRDIVASAIPLAEALTLQWQFILRPLIGAVSLILLIACANVANLLLARAASRRREISLRSALGAGRHRLIRELLADSFALAVPGAIVALGVAWGGIRLFLALYPDFPEPERVGFSIPVLGFSALAALVSAMIAGLTPAWLASKTDITEALKDGSRGSASGSRVRLRSALVAAEIALATTLLACAGLMINTMIRLSRVPLGFDPSGVFAMSLDMGSARYMSFAPKRDIDMRFIEPSVNRFYQDVIEQARALPGVLSVAIGSGIPMSNGGGFGVFTISGRPESAPRDRPEALFGCVTERYFELLRIPVLRGRGIEASDREGAPWVVVINEALARQYFPNEDPLGQSIVVRTTEFEQPRRIVGIVADHKRFSRRTEPRAQIFMSFPQQPRLIPGNHQALRLRPQLLLRTAGPVPVTEDLERIVARLDRQVPLFDATSLGEQVARRGWFDRLFSRLFGLSAGLALFLAAIGIYGLMHHSVNDRIHEIGIRMALGAGRGEVLRLILRSGLVLAGVGIAIGIAGALASARLIQQLLFGVKPHDPATLAAVAVVLLAVALAACYFPARRAMSVDPLLALRRE